jgi:tRNA(fMet)-specific endonuclease VapC
LLDTNVVSALMRNPQGGVRQRIEHEAGGDAAISIITLAELRFGVAKTGSKRLAAILDALTRSIAVFPLQEPVDQVYGEIRSQLERAGTPIGPNDNLIAAHAIVLDRMLVTANVREFSRVPGLRVENWLD